MAGQAGHDEKELAMTKKAGHDEKEPAMTSCPT